jgi:hypothetical protein
VNDVRPAPFHSNRSVAATAKPCTSSPSVIRAGRRKGARPDAWQSPTERRLMREDAGILSWIQRIKRVHERCSDLLGDNGWRWRVLRTSNAYNFRDPSAPSAVLLGRSDRTAGASAARTPGELRWRWLPDSLTQCSISFSDQIPAEGGANRERETVICRFATKWTDFPHAAAGVVTSSAGGRRPHAQGVSDNAWSFLRAAPKLPSW